MEQRLFVAVMLTVTILAGTGFTSPQNQLPVDAVSSASVKNHFENATLSKDDLLKVIKKREAAFVLSTTNPDGSPNAAVFIPGVVSDSVLKFGLAENQSLKNIRRTGVAVLTVYCWPSTAPGNKKHAGARLVLKHLEEARVENKKHSRVTLEIVRIMPIG